MTYRLMIDGIPAFVSMKASNIHDKNRNQIVIGINNINAEMEERDKALIYSSISKALAGNYFSIYYVDMDTEEYIELISHEEFNSMNIEKSGGNFFTNFGRKIMKYIHPDDREAFVSAFTKENIRECVSQGERFTVNYRQQLNGKWIHLHLSASAEDEHDESHIVIGVSNIEEQVRREEEHIQAIRHANLDALTGVRNKHVYLENELEINSSISEGNAEPFALVFCDLNGLKRINDTYGHAEGDEFIRQASRTIVSIFKHSPVYRVGGDEFLVILRDEDYQNRDYLHKMLTSLNYAQTVGRKVVIASGMADFDPEKDASLAEVVRRADAKMYENKKSLKQDLGV